MQGDRGRVGIKTGLTQRWSLKPKMAAEALEIPGLEDCTFLLPPLEGHMSVSTGGTVTRQEG